ncbi:N6-L-threonylcarbamoyladenine synthase [Mycoplasmopsis mustelae]|uniref:tRNA N6-adenosine threonylcarbamoyltransferase n=1 Tax=Mycoplasmopsis mustelae TaxID=171289 RepID=A0A4R7UF29_9BACT|nr:tRNA (adenosine(37)-N6)-threonylcarbamoyltransferase complex transferase subunit TsaD [Mycoplasmopsis mustelae]TDV24264.1 N6-L-threonylcarbamoyladenine synthase [Mycoplasmopsis mustelae]
MRILGIETSHDDTSLAILENGKILDMWTVSQIDIFKEFGGTIPELASREHVKNIAILQNLVFGKYPKESFDYIAYTKEPGLIGTLQIGYLFASAVALSLKVPLIPINHLHGHILSASITNKIQFPALCLLVSGGHTQLLLANSVSDFEILGETLDDAVGEVFDKIAVKSNLGFPGGIIIDKISANYSNEYINFTKPHTENKYDFSFSGLKTQVLNYLNNQKQKNKEVNINQVVASFQKTAVEYLCEKTKLALAEFDVKTLILGGGVSANSQLRREFIKLHKNTIIPKIKYATDNAAMIAEVAYLQLTKK